VAFADAVRFNSDQSQGIILGSNRMN